MCVSTEQIVSVWPPDLAMTKGRFALVAAAWEARGPLTTQEIIEAIGVSDNCDGIICEVPEGFELTDERWNRILEAWEAGAYEFLDCEKVLGVFGLSPTDPPGPSIYVGLFSPLADSDGQESVGCEQG